MSDQESSEEEGQSDSDEEVPMLQLCCLSLTDLHSLDLSTTQDFSVLLAAVAIGNSEKALTAITIIRKSLGEVTDPPIQAIIDAGGVEVIHKATKNEDERICLEATWVLTNLLSGSSKQTSKVLQSHCIPILADLLNFDESWDVKEQVILALGNIAADSPRWRNKVLEAGGLTAILSHIKADCLRYVKRACWAVSNMIRMKPPPPITYLTQAGPFILSQLRSIDDMETRSDLLWALNDITKSTVESIGLNQEICIDLVQWMDTTTLSISYPTVCAFSNIIGSSGEYTDIFIESGLLWKVGELLEHPKGAIRKETCRLLHNLCAENPKVVEKVFQFGIISLMTANFMTETENVKQEIVWVLGSICTHSSPRLLPKLMEIGICAPLVKALSCPSRKAVVASLQGLTALIQYGKKHLDSEKLSSYMDVGELVEKCTALASMSEAKKLLRRAAWLLPDDKEVQAEPDTRKHPRH